MTRRFTKYTIEEAKTLVESRGHTLLSTEYKNVKSPLVIICRCGNKVRKSLGDILNTKGCKECMGNTLSSHFRFSYDYVYNFFKSNGCTLLSKEYKNSKEKLDYVCVCGNKSSIKFEKFKKGQRCQECGNRKTSKKTKGIKRPQWSGENSPNWKNTKTDEERLSDRKYREYHKWRKSVFERDSYTCQYCGVYGYNLNAHHLNGYSWDYDNRLNVNNGITLCDSCHNLYHFIFGKKNVVVDDYLIFIEDVSWDINYRIMIDE